MPFMETLIPGPCELVLHKVQGDSSFIEEIINPLISGRKKGDQTDVLGLYHSGKYTHQAFSETRYFTAKSGATIKGNTFFIRNQAQDLIGMLCVNVNVSPLVETHNWIVDFMKGFTPPVLDTRVSEGTIEDYTYETIDQVILSSKITPSRMSPEEKIEVLKLLDSKGVFRVKGSMAYISKQLAISEPTLYRYLKEI